MKKIISYTRWVLLGVVIPGALALLALLFFPIEMSNKKVFSEMECSITANVPTIKNRA